MTAFQSKAGARAEPAAAVGGGDPGQAAAAGGTDRARVWPLQHRVPLCAPDTPSLPSILANWFSAPFSEPAIMPACCVSAHCHGKACCSFYQSHFQHI